MIESDPNLGAIYQRIYFEIAWPAALPRPEEVRVRWNRRFKRTSGACLRRAKIIEVNVIYRDPRLSEELKHLLVHEAAHFLWYGHPPAFKGFLRSIGVPESYVLCESGPSPIYRIVQRERSKMRVFREACRAPYRQCNGQAVLEPCL
jgi:hypothetical protein